MPLRKIDSWSSPPNIAVINADHPSLDGCLARSLNNQETGASIIIWEQTFPSLRLCTKNTWWALIERPYSCAPQAVGAVYDRPGFFVQSPSLQRRGGCAERSEGADGVARSASPIGRSLNRRPAEIFRRADHPGATARWLSRHPSSARRGINCSIQFL